MLLLLASLIVAQAFTPGAEFKAWKTQWGKTYTTRLEERYREFVFRTNAYMIEQRNAEQSHVRLGLNAFADLTQDEFAEYYLSAHKPRVGKYRVAYTELPDEINWVQKGAVTPVKNQGQCGSCWSFSTTGAVEGAWFLKMGTLISLSEQQLVDCSTPEGNQGCNGGMMDHAFEYIVSNGICSEASYPYLAADGTCHTCTTVAKITSYVNVQPNNETALMAAVAQQPVSVAVQASGLDWQFYMGGILSDACGTALDHGVLVVGYGNTTSPYWIVKNSWGPTWGESGYIRIARGSTYAPNGECGILMDPSYPVV